MTLPLCGNRLHAVVLGAWGIPGPSGGLGSLELSIFVGSTEGCVFIDGQRLFQTLPQSYLIQWRCRTGKGVLSSSASAISYSGNVALISCNFEDRAEPSHMHAASIFVEAEREGLRNDGWIFGPLQLCPWNTIPAAARHPFSPAVTGGASSSSGTSMPRSLTVCSEVLYKLAGPYAEALVAQWLEYHRMIGVDHFVLYDRDGSLNAGGLLDAYILSGFVTYFPRFPRVLSRDHQAVHGAAGLPSHAAPDAQAASHCIFLSRGVSDWVAFLHAPDEYLSSTRGMRHIREIILPLQRLRDLGLAVVDVSQIYFLRGPHEKAHRPSPLLLGRYVHRPRRPIELPKWGSLQASTFLNRFASPIVDPLRVSDIVSEHYPRAKVDSLYLDNVPQSFARVNHYGEAFGPRDVLPEEKEFLVDESALWAVEPLLANPAARPLPDWHS